MPHCAMQVGGEQLWEGWKAGTDLWRGRDTVTFISVLDPTSLQEMITSNLVPEEVPSEVWRQFGHSLI